MVTELALHTCMHVTYRPSDEYEASVESSRRALVVVPEPDFLVNLWMMASHDTTYPLSSCIVSVLDCSCPSLLGRIAHLFSALEALRLTHLSLSEDQTFIHLWGTIKMSSATLTNPSQGSERTPLLAKSHSQSAVPTQADDGLYADLEGDGEDDGPKGREVEVYKPGKSTFTQTVSLPPLSSYAPSENLLLPSAEKE